MDDSLISFIEDVCGDSHLRVEDDLGDGFVRLRSAEAERRQAQHDIRCTEDIVIEMLRNARDAGARNIFLALSREGSVRRLNMIDDGSGIPEALHDLVFEPRITSKLNTIHVDKWGVHGRGMALFSIKENTRKAKVVNSLPGRGSSFLIEIDLNSLGEKSDQSSVPLFSFDEEGALHVKGPHNINRIVAEFSYDSRAVCHVFCGSPIDIVAALYEFGASTLTKTERTFCEDLDSIPIGKRLAIAADATDLARLAGNIGLVISERSARRVLDGEIRAPHEVLDTLRYESNKSESQHHIKPGKIHKRLLKDRRGLKISADDLFEFEEQITKAYKELSEKYYLESAVKPSVHISRNRIEINIDFNKIR